MNKTEITHHIKAKAIDLGFLGITMAKAEFMEEEARNLEQWLNQNYHGEMHYMSNHFDKRVDPTKLVPGSKTVISLMYNYFNEEELNEDSDYKIAMYAYGKDYHIVVKQKLEELFEYCKEIVGEIEGRCFVDSAPILERDWAKRSGLGWIGKNTLLINPKKGSFFFLGELVIDVELDYDQPIRDYCGTCKRCIVACPTEAISPEGYLLDSNKCISYLTIELKNEIPDEYKNQMENYIFGCDICQKVCPWNRFSTPHTETEFNPSGVLKNMGNSDWANLTQEVFSKVFSKSAVKRTKYSGLRRNIDFLNS
jgi:epoxyqueuosine reductase